MVWAVPVSLAATQGIDFSFFSSRYLDVSVPWVCLLNAMVSGSKLTYSSPKHIGVSPVLHRLLVPRHPPCALNNLTFSVFDTLRNTSSISLVRILMYAYSTLRFSLAHFLVLLASRNPYGFQSTSHLRRVSLVVCALQ